MHIHIKNSLLIICLAIICSNLYSQESKKPIKVMGALEVYILKVKPLSKIGTIKTRCIYGKKVRKFNIYEIEIKRIFHIEDTTVYKKENELYKVKYCLFPRKFKINMKSEQVVTGYNLNSKDYIVVEKSLYEFIENIEYRYVYQYGYVVGIKDCYKTKFIMKLKQVL